MTLSLVVMVGYSISSSVKRSSSGWGNAETGFSTNGFASSIVSLEGEHLYAPVADESGASGLSSDEGLPSGETLFSSFTRLNLLRSRCFRALHAIWPLLVSSCFPFAPLSHHLSPKHGRAWPAGQNSAFVFLLKLQFLLNLVWMQSL